MYGYVQPPGKGDFNSRKIRIERLGASRHDDLIEGVQMVWVARKPNVGGTDVVGNYSDATVVQEWHEPPQGSNRTSSNELLGYFAKAKQENCVLLPVEKRTFQIPRGKDYMGQANIWYPAEGFEQQLMQFIQNYEP
jgi:hypothetical protein